MGLDVDIETKHDPFYNKTNFFYMETYIIYKMYNFLKTIITNFEFFLSLKTFKIRINNVLHKDPIHVHLKKSTYVAFIMKYTKPIIKFENIW